MIENQSIHDDSHGRALLLRMMREGREAYMSRFKSLTSAKEFEKPRRYNFKEYRRNCDAQVELYGDSLIHALRHKHHRTKRELTHLISFGGFQFFEPDYKNNKEGKSYPVVLETVDSKLTSANGLLCVICRLSEHALVKMIRRSHCASLGDLVELIKQNIEPFIRCMVSTDIDYDFVAVCAESYMPCTIDEGKVVVLKTWIPRSVWTPATEAKLWQACEALSVGNRIAVIPTDIFLQKSYWNADHIKPYLVE